MKKKVFSIILAGALVLGLTACSGNTETETAGTAEATIASTQMEESQADETTSGSTQVQSEPQEEVTQEETSQEDEAEEGKKILIAYFSWSGNTEKLANMIQQETGGDLFEITPAEPYTEDYDALLEQAQQEQQDQVRPELAGQVDNWEEYDVVFVGYPNWWGDTPMAVLTFLESYDFGGKTLVPFCTHGSGGFGGSLASVENSAAGAELLEGVEVSGSSVDGAAEQVTEWLDTIGLNQ